MFSKAFFFRVVKSEDFVVKSSTFPERQILDSSKLKEFADDHFEFAENCGKFSKRVENTVDKTEIACYEQFLLYPRVFSKGLYCRHIKIRACLGKG